MQGNNAIKYGGAVYSVQPTISIADRTHLDPSLFHIGSLHISNVQFSQNRAYSGASMYVLGNGANVTLISSEFSRSERCAEIIQGAFADAACLTCVASAGAMQTPVAEPLSVRIVPRSI